jgi:hypothetical protein
MSYKLVAEKKEASSANLTIPHWCSIMEIVRTYFAPSETRGDKPPTDRIFELPPKNLKKYRLEPHFVKENFKIN